MKNTNKNEHGYWLCITFLDEMEGDDWSAEDFDSHVQLYVSDEWRLHQDMQQDENQDLGCVAVSMNLLNRLTNSLKQAINTHRIKCGLKVSAAYTEAVIQDLAKLADKGNLFYRWKVCRY